MAEPKENPGPLMADPQSTGIQQEISSTDTQVQEKPRRHSAIPAPGPPPTGILGFFSRLGDLPEWKVRGELLSGTTLNYCIGFIASCGFLMFGYDQGVLSALLTLDDFQKDIPLMTPRQKSNALCWLDEARTIPDLANCTGSPNTQAAGVAIYQIGCFLGAVVILFYGETWGRKSSTFWGSAIMILGTILQCAAMEYGLFCAGRVIGGIGNGMVTSSEQLPSSSILLPSLTQSSHSYMAVRVRSSAPARVPHHPFWRPHLGRHHDRLLGRLRLLLPRGHRPLALPRRLPVLLHHHRHDWSALPAGLPALAGHEGSHGRGSHRDGPPPGETSRR